jgi:hypothetical protein
VKEHHHEGKGKAAKVTNSCTLHPCYLGDRQVIIHAGPSAAILDDSCEDTSEHWGGGLSF